MNIEEERAQREKKAQEKGEKARINQLTLFRQQLRDSFGDTVENDLGLTVEYTESGPIARAGEHIISQHRHDDGQRDWILDGQTILRWRRSGNDHASNLLRLVELVEANVVAM